MRGILVLIFLTCLLPNVFAAGAFGDPLLDGLTLYDSGEYKKATPLLLNACESGKSRGCYYAGMIYSYNDDHTEAAYEKALRFFTKSCDMDGLGCDEVDRLYYFGKIINKETTAKAAKYDADCAAGDGEACLRLGIMYASGDKIKHDKDKSVKLYERACKLKNAEGCLYLGAPMLNISADYEPYSEKGNVEPMNNAEEKAVCEKGLAIVQKSCDMGFGKACGKIGVIYLYNYDYSVNCVTPNNIKGIDYLIKGCELKDNDACSVLKYITEMEDI